MPLEKQESLSRAYIYQLENMNQLKQKKNLQFYNFLGFLSPHLATRCVIIRNKDTAPSNMRVLGLWKAINNRKFKFSEFYF